jgi:hypothetical protein
MICNNPKIMFFYTFKYSSSNTLYMNFQVSSKSLCSYNNSILQFFKDSPRCHKRKRKVAVTRPSALMVLLIFVFLYSVRDFNK